MRTASFNLPASAVQLGAAARAGERAPGVAAFDTVPPTT